MRGPRSGGALGRVIDPKYLTHETSGFASPMTRSPDFLTSGSTGTAPIGGVTPVCVA